MATQGALVVDPTSLKKVMAKMAAIPVGVDQGAMTIGRGFAVRMEGYAKKNRPWTDDTGQARARLHGYARKVAFGDIAIGVAHGVDYGVFLELAKAGKYAILKPTLDHFRPQLEAAIKRTVLPGV